MPFDILNPSVGDLVVFIDAANMPTSKPCIYTISHLANGRPKGHNVLVLYTAAELTERYATSARILKDAQK